MGTRGVQAINHRQNKAIIPNIKKEMQAKTYCHIVEKPKSDLINIENVKEAVQEIRKRACDKM
jgi:predicted RNA-binding protein with EMAP domain